MDSTNKLFKWKNPYDILASNSVFIEAVRENFKFQYTHCSEYKRIMDEKNFCIESLQTINDLSKLPFIPTLYFKHHEMFSVPKNKLIIKATSSGTSGTKSKIGLDVKSALRGLRMVLKMAKHQKLFSIHPCHYLMLGYQPHKSNQTSVTKSAKGSTLFAFALSKTYALTFQNGNYQLNLEAIIQKLIKLNKKKSTIRIVGFPSYTFFLLDELKKRNIFLKFSNKSKILLGGGWKHFYAQAVNKELFYELVQEVLGIEDYQIIETFSAVEHPILTMDCKCHHFHIPVYSRVLIRDPITLQPLPNGQVGLVNLITPMIQSCPVLSIATDDLGILHDGATCPCGNKAPYLEIIGRVGIQDITTCAAGAQQFIRK